MQRGIWLLLLPLLSLQIVLCVCACVCGATEAGRRFSETRDIAVVQCASFAPGGALFASSSPRLSERVAREETVRGERLFGCWLVGRSLLRVMEFIRRCGNCVYHCYEWDN